MPRLDNFTYSSDFDTLKNDGDGTAQITIPASATVGVHSSGTWIQDLTIGLAASMVNTRIRSVTEGDKWYVLSSFSFSRIGTIPGPSAAAYNVNVSVFHLNSTTVRCIVTVQNPYASILTVSGSPDVYDFYVRSYLAPRFV